MLTPWLETALVRSAAGAAFAPVEADLSDFQLTTEEASLTVPGTDDDDLDIADAADVEMGLEHEQEAITAQLWVTATQVSLAVAALLAAGLLLALGSVRLSPTMKKRLALGPGVASRS